MYETILVPVDGSQGSRRATRHAVGIAERFGADVHALYVVDVTAIQASAPDLDLNDVRRSMRETGEGATAAVAEVAGEAGVDCTTSLVEGTTPEAILDYAADHDVDLIVMGTHGRRGIERFFRSSVAERVVRRANVPVMTVHLSDEDG